jgi:hypothetical protein
MAEGAVPAGTTFRSTSPHPISWISLNECNFTFRVTVFLLAVTVLSLNQFWADTVVDAIHRPIIRPITAYNLFFIKPLF